MVIRGNSRSNARQLSHYLLAKKDNEAIRILDVNGQIDPAREDLHRAIYLMGVSAELSKSDKGLYHAQINPAIGEDAAMQDEQWLQAADILGRQLGLVNQARAIVLHTKKGRTHAHVVWERYDHDKGKMVSDSFSRLAQDRARKEMEAVFGQAPTPHRNKHRPELKASLSALWHQTGTGAQFVKAARKNGYIISEGTGRSPYMVVDENGRSYDLTRQLQGVRLKDVRQRLRHESLMGEKDAIAFMRKNNGNQEQGGDNGTGKQTSHNKRNTMMHIYSDNKDDMTTHNNPKQPTLKEKLAASRQEITGQQQNKEQLADNKAEITNAEKKPAQEQNAQEQFKDNKPDVTGQEKDKSLKEQFAENKADTRTDAQKDKDRRREEFRKRMQPEQGNERTKERGVDME
jgi:hypothetical protein